MNILFINPMARYLYPLAEDMSEFPSLGLGYLASPLPKQGHKVFYIDAFDKKYLRENFKKIDPRIVVCGDFYFRTYFAFMFPVMKQIAEDIKSVNKECFLIIAGAFASNYPYEILKQSVFDGVICGEGEESLPKIISAMKDEKELSAIRGFVFKRKNQIKGIKERGIVKNLDNLLFPDRDIFNNKMAKGSHGRFLSSHFDQMVVSRGCPFGCDYCVTHTMYGRSVRRRSIENVFAEISYLKNVRNIDYIIFWDDTFTADREFSAAFCHKMKDFGIKWSCNTRADMVDEELLALMRDGGCDSILYGVECAQNDVLNKISKSKGSSRFSNATQKAFYLTNKAGIKSVASIIAGLPDDDAEHIYNDFNYAKSLSPSRIYMRPALAIPGTKFYENLVEAKRVSPWERWDEEDVSTPPYGYPALCKNVSRTELQELINKIKNSSPEYFL